MIDKLDVRIPAETPFTREFADFYREMRSMTNSIFRPGKLYEISGDLRSHYDAILHMCCKHGRAANHKLELLDTGRRGFKLLVHEIQRIFVVDVPQLEIMRVDLAVDVKDVPVSYFEQFVRAAYKQVVNDIEDAAQLTRMGRGDLQTVYLGKRPNLYRIYNKIAELKKQYAAILRKADDSESVPSFQQMFGYPAEGLVVTRVERQYGGGRIPEQIATIRDLWRNVSGIKPFEPLKIVGNGKLFKNPDNYDLNKYLKGQGLSSLIQQYGTHRVRQFINRKSKGNAARIFRDLADFLPAAQTSPPDLNQLFIESITRQCYASTAEPEFARITLTLGGSK